MAAHGTRSSAEVTMPTNSSVDSHYSATIGEPKDSEVQPDEGSDATFRGEVTSVTGGAPRSRSPRVRAGLLPPFGRRAWNCDEVARHLMQRRRPIIRGLARRSPFFGIDDDTLEGLYGEAAAKIA